MEIFGDFYPSVIRAFDEIDLYWKQYPGLVICGSHNPTNTEELIEKIKHARESGLPFYGECFGYQLACIELAREMGIKDATSEEFGQGTFVIVKRKDGLNVGLKNGESFWNNYEATPVMAQTFKNREPNNFFTAQYHASYQSRLDNPHPLIKNFLKYAKSYSQSR